MNILMVCTGNTCRSAMAEGILKYIIEKEKISEKVTVASAGIAAIESEPASEASKNVLEKLWKIDISMHKSHYINEKDIKKSDLILVMTREHRMVLAARYSEDTKKIFTLKQYVENVSVAYHKNDEYDFTLDIQDPFGMPEIIYEKTAKDLYTTLEKLVAKLKSLLE